MSRNKRKIWVWMAIMMSFTPIFSILKLIGLNNTSWIDIIIINCVVNIVFISYVFIEIISFWLRVRSNTQKLHFQMEKEIREKAYNKEMKQSKELELIYH